MNATAAKTSFRQARTRLEARVAQEQGQGPAELKPQRPPGPWARFKAAVLGRIRQATGTAKPPPRAVQPSACPDTAAAAALHYGDAVMRVAANRLPLAQRVVRQPGALHDALRSTEPTTAAGQLALLDAAETVRAEVRGKNLAAIGRALREEGADAMVPQALRAAGFSVPQPWRETLPDDTVYFVDEIVKRLASARPDFKQQLLGWTDVEGLCRQTMGDVQQQLGTLNQNALRAALDGETFAVALRQVGLLPAGEGLSSLPLSTVTQLQTLARERAAQQPGFETALLTRADLQAICHDAASACRAAVDTIAQRTLLDGSDDEMAAALRQTGVVPEGPWREALPAADVQRLTELVAQAGAGPGLLSQGALEQVCAAAVTQWQQGRHPEPTPPTP